MRRKNDLGKFMTVMKIVIDLPDRGMMQRKASSKDQLMVLIGLRRIPIPISMVEKGRVEETEGLTCGENAKVRKGKTRLRNVKGMQKIPRIQGKVERKVAKDTTDRPTKDPVLRLDAHGRKIDEHGNVIDKTKLTNPSNLKRMTFQFVEEGRWSKQAEILKFKSQFGEAQAKELKIKQAHLAKEKAEAKRGNGHLGYRMS
eukprot:Gb_00236 [translate_table: standard]